jgi:hypothetical protein
MKQEDLLKCPLLQGLDAMHRAELLGLINDSNLRSKLETCLAEHQTADPTAQPACAGAKPGNFEKDVHSWQPDTPLWRRSSKE